MAVASSATLDSGAVIAVMMNSSFDGFAVTISEVAADNLWSTVSTDNLEEAAVWVPAVASMSGLLCFARFDPSAA